MYNLNMPLLTKQKRDTNEPEIIAALRAMGAGVDQMDKSVGWDLNVYYRGIIFAFEVKSSEKAKLSDNEVKQLAFMKQYGCNIYRVNSPEEAIMVLEQAWDHVAGMFGM